MRIQTPDVIACNPREYCVDITACHQLGFLYGALDSLHRRFDINYHAFLQSARSARPDADDFYLVSRGNLCNYRDDFGSPDIKPNN